MLKPGDRFGDYAVVRLLGKGGMGAVYLLETASGGQVAAKILNPEDSADHESRKRFLREAELALGVKHPNLVETYDVGEDPDTGLCYILMEYVPGGSLADRLKAGPLPINDAIRIVYQIASVLELAREKGIVHRDIKPANIMFGADGKAKLADLGIARGGVGGANVTTVTQTGMMIGTPAYMAPEQMLDAHHVDSRADIYSLGIVFYEMLAGQRPNPTDTVVQLMAKAVAGEPIPDVRTMRPEVSAAVAELISLMCAMTADERIATPREVTTAISLIVHGREVTIRRKSPTVVKKEPAGEKSRFPVAAVVVGLLVAGGAALFWLGRPSARPTQRPTERATQVFIVTNTIEKVVERTYVASNDVGTAHLVGLGSNPLPSLRRTPKFSMRSDASALRWLDDAPHVSAPVRMCLDLSHGGYPSKKHASYVRWLEHSGVNFRQKACWHDLTTENLEPVNVLILPATPAQVLYDEKECAVIDRFMREGGTVIVLNSVSDNNLWIADKFLSRYGLEQFILEGCEHPSVERCKQTVPVQSPCRSFQNLKMVFPVLMQAAPSSEEGAAAWTTIVREPERNAVQMAMRSVGKGHLIWSADWQQWWGAADVGELKDVWLRIFRAAAATRLIKASAELGERPSTDAPIVRRVGPITIYAANRWRRHVDVLARIVALGLPRLEAYCGHALDPEKMSTTKFVLTGTSIWGYLPAGEKTIVTSATFRGFPDRLLYLSHFVFRMMLTGSLQVRVPHAVAYCSYVSLLAFCDLGYSQEMATVIAEGRAKDPDFRRYRYVNDHVVDVASGRTVSDRHNFIANSKFFSAYEEVRAKTPDFPLRYVERARTLDHDPSQREFAKILSEISGCDVMALFGKYGIVLESETGVGRGMRGCDGPGSPGMDRSSALDRTLRDQKAVDALFPGWSISGNRPQSASDGSLVVGSVLSYRGRANVFLTHPADDKAPAVLSRTLKLNQRHPVLLMEVASVGKDADFLLTVKVNGHPVSAPRVICTPDMRPYERLVVPLAKWRGRKVKIEVEHSANGGYYEHAFWSKLEIAECDGKEKLGPVGVACTEVFPAAKPKTTHWKKRSVWKYVTEEPADGWKDLGFDDGKWKRTVKALGCDKKPLLMSVADPWRSDRIWIRRKFNWTGPTDIYKVDYDLCFDQDVEIYLNGREVLRRGGWNVDWVPTAGDARAFASALRQGENVLAVTLKGDGASYFDCGLSIETYSDKVKKEEGR